MTNKRDKFLALTPLAVLGLVLGLVTLVEMRAGRVGGTEELSGRLVGRGLRRAPAALGPVGGERGRLEGRAATRSSSSSSSSSTTSASPSAARGATRAAAAAC